MALERHIPVMGSFLLGYSKPGLLCGMLWRLRFLTARLKGMCHNNLNAETQVANERLLSEIISTQGNHIASVCLSFANSREEFEDLRQDVLLNIWRGLDKFRRDSSLSTWIYRITLNTCVSYIRKNKVSERQTIAFNEFYEVLFDDSSTEKVELYRTMYRMIGSLKPLDRSMILLWLDEKPYNEIAEIMGMSRNAVASRLKRAKEQLGSMNPENFQS